MQQKTNFNVKTRAYVRRGRYNNGYAHGYATTTRSIESYPEGTLLLTFINRNKKEVVWTGVAKGAYSRNDLDDEFVNKIIADLLKDFPRSE